MIKNNAKDIVLSGMNLTFIILFFLPSIFLIIFGFLFFNIEPGFVFSFYAINIVYNTIMISFILKLDKIFKEK